MKLTFMQLIYESDPQDGEGILRGDQFQLFFLWGFFIYLNHHLITLK